jgi:hypothetical protein
VDVVDRQVAAYNAHDLESFSACYALEVTIRDREGKTLISGIDAVRREYHEWFAAHPDVRADVRSRLVSGAWVVDEETVTTGDATMSALLAYHVAAGLIDAVLLLAEDP